MLLINHYIVYAQNTAQGIFLCDASRVLVVLEKFGGERRS
jgi:hypothetical protein